MEKLVYWTCLVRRVFLPIRHARWYTNTHRHFPYTCVTRKWNHREPQGIITSLFSPLRKRAATNRIQHGPHGRIFSQKVDRRRRCYLAETSVVGGGESSGSNAMVSRSLKRGNEMFIEEEKIWCWPILAVAFCFDFFVVSIQERFPSPPPLLIEWRVDAHRSENLDVAPGTEKRRVF